MGTHTEVTHGNVARGLQYNDRSPASMSSLKETAATKQADDRKVTFSKVHLREYERILGDHPNAMDGPPISIGWRYIKKPSYLVNEYESLRTECKQKERLENEYVGKSSLEKGLKPLAGYVRRNICLYDLNHTEEEINHVLKESEKIQRQRVKSIRRQQAYENIMTSTFIRNIGKTMPWLDQHSSAGTADCADVKGPRELSRTFRGAVQAVVFGMSTLSKARTTLSDEVCPDESGVTADATNIKNDDETKIEADSKNTTDQNKRRAPRELSRLFRGAVHAVVFSSSTLNKVKKTESNNEGSSKNGNIETQEVDGERYTQN